MAAGQPDDRPNLGTDTLDQHGPRVRRLAGRGKCSRGAGHTHTREERVKAATPGGRDLRTTLDYRDFAFVKYLRRYGVSPCTCSPELGAGWNPTPWHSGQFSQWCGNVHSRSAGQFGGTPGTCTMPPLHSFEHALASG